MKNGCLITIVVFLFLIVISNSFESSGSTSRSNSCSERIEIAALIRSLGPQYFKNPKSFDFEQRTMKIYQGDTEDDYQVYFDAYAQNGFGATQIGHYTAIIEKRGSCNYAMTNLIIR